MSKRLLVSFFLAVFTGFCVFGSFYYVRKKEVIYTYSYSLSHENVEQVLRDSGIPVNSVDVRQSRQPTGGTGFVRDIEKIVMYDVSFTDKGKGNYDVSVYINEQQWDLSALKPDEIASLNSAVIQSLSLEIVSKLYYKYVHLEPQFCESKKCGEEDFRIFNVI